MAIRRGRGQFSAPTTRSGKSFTYSGRRVLVRSGNQQFVLNWNGAAVQAAVLVAVESALRKLSNEALQYMQSIVPVDTGRLRDSCFVEVSVFGGRIRVSIGADTRYAIFVELGTSSHPAKPYIRPTYDYVVRILPELLKKEAASRASRVA